jgi:hypothetical protein
MSVAQRYVLAMVVLSALASMTTAAHAGAGQPCIAATLSTNGSILVVNQLTFDDPNDTFGRRPLSSTFLVLRHYVEINEGLRLNGPNSYWSDPLWSVVIKNSGNPPVACPYTLVTDDGEYLILVGSALGQDDALAIYRRRDHPGHPFGGPGPDHGLLVRHIPLRDLWPPEHISGEWNDHTPQWFATGTFAFSPDNRTLIHKTRWGQTLQISLETGAVTSQ